MRLPIVTTVLPTFVSVPVTKRPRAVFNVSVAPDARG